MTAVPFESKDWEEAYDRMKAQRDELKIKLQNMCAAWEKVQEEIAEKNKIYNERLAVLAEQKNINWEKWNYREIEESLVNVEAKLKIATEALETYFASGFPRGPEEQKLEQALAKIRG